MYKLLIFSLLAAFAAADNIFSTEFLEKQLGNVKEMFTKCAAKENAIESDIQEVMSQKPASRREGKCLIACVNQEMQIQDTDGKFSKEGALKSLEPFKGENGDIYNKLTKIVDDCWPAVKSSDRCDAADEMENCFNTKVEKIGLASGILA